MKTQFDMNENVIQTALRYMEIGLWPIPIVTGSKQAAIKWKQFQTKAPTREEVVAWFSSGERNIGLVTGNGVVVVDVDDPSILDKVLHHCGETPMRCRTPRGGWHLWYRMRADVHYGNSVKIKSRPIDLRCEGAYVCVPWSRNEQGNYQWAGPVLPPAELPMLRPEWLRERSAKRLVMPIDVTAHCDEVLRRARAYLSRVEGAVSGQGGHNRTFRVACILAHKFGLTLEQAWPLLLEWNNFCDPPWSEKDLLHKLQDAFKLRFAFQKEGA